MSAGYEALTTKVKAMYGKRLRYADFVRMAQMGSVGEIHADLRQHPVWGSAAARLDGAAWMSRARLEASLREQIRREYVRLLPFIPRRDRELMAFPVLRSELGGLLFTLTRLQAGRSGEGEALPDRFVLRGRADMGALARCADYDGLLEAAKGSAYYDALLRLRPADGSLPDYTTVEARLFSVYYGHMLKVVAKRYEGDVRRTLEKSFGSQADMLNIMHILRLKQFFPGTDDFMDVLFPVRYKLTPEQTRAMCEADGAQGVLAVVAGTPYAKQFCGVSMDGLQRVYDETLFRLCRRQLMLGGPSIYSTVAFLNLRMLEMKELITVVETVKYQADYDDRFARVVGS